MLTDTEPLARELEAALRLDVHGDHRPPTVRLDELAHALERADDPRLAALGAYLARLAGDYEYVLDDMAFRMLGAEEKVREYGRRTALPAGIAGGGGRGPREGATRIGDSAT